MQVSCGSRTSGTSATTRRVGSTYLLSTSTLLCTFLAGPIPLTSSRAGGSATARGQRSPRATPIPALRRYRALRRGRGRGLHPRGHRPRRFLHSVLLPRQRSLSLSASCTRSSLPPSAPPCQPIPSWSPPRSSPGQCPRPGLRYRLGLPGRQPLCPPLRRARRAALPPEPARRPLVHTIGWQAPRAGAAGAPRDSARWPLRPR
jgi:hypothetical protein